MKETLVRQFPKTGPNSGKTARPKLMAVVPAFNEEDNVPRVIQELSDLKLEACAVDFLIVDDGSQDATRARARAAGAKVVSLPYNLGIGIAVQTGFQYALEHDADLVVQVDGDCQHIPAEISKLLPLILDGAADVVIGSRFSPGQTGGIKTTTVSRWLGGRLLSFSVKLLTGVRVMDTTSGFRLFNRAASEFVAQNYPDDYPEVEILVMLANRGFKIREVPVQMRGRFSGHSSITWTRSIYYMIKVILGSFFQKVRGK